MSSTTASTATSVHQRPLPCRHHRFRFSDQITDYTIRKKSLRSPFLWNFVFIGPSTRCHQKSRRHSHAPPASSTRRHALPRANVPLLTSALGDVICHVIATSSADVICHGIRWRHLPRHLLTSSLTLTVDFDRWLWLGVDFFSSGSSYPVFRVDFIFAVYFCILCL